MKYHIEIEEKDGSRVILANFKHLQDRNDCFDYLSEKYKDCVFIAHDE